MNDIVLVGVDEVGLGALAGPVVACAYFANAYPPKLTDSKQLSRSVRERLYGELVRNSRILHVVAAPASEVASRGMGPVWQTVMRSCVLMANELGADDVVVDGNRGIKVSSPYRIMIKADTKVPAVSAASVVAKVVRDRLMSELAEVYPGYGWETNAGYPTKVHKEALARLGPTPEHRYEEISHELRICQQHLPLPWVAR